MANLSDIVAALDRLGEKLGAPAEAAEAFKPSLVRALPEPKSATMTADMIGVSVARHVGAMPGLRAMNQQLTIIAQTLKRQGPQTTPQTGQRVLPIAQPLQQISQAMARISVPTRQGNATIDIMRLLSSGAGGMPIIGTAMRHAGLLQTLLGGDVSPIPAPGTTAKSAASGYRQWRDSLKSSPVSEAIMKGWKNFGPGAAGKRLANDWKLLTTMSSERASITQRYGAGTEGEAKGFALLDKAAMGAAIDFAMVGGSVIAVAASVVKFGKAITDANRAISGYSPLLAMSYAISDIRDVFRDMKTAREIANPQARFITAFGNFKDAMQPLQVALERLILSMGTTILKIAAPLTNLADKILSPDLNRLSAASDMMSHSMDIWKSIFTGNWGGVKENFKGGINDWKHLLLGDNSGDSGSTKSGIAEGQRALQEAIDALKANTAALKEKTGGDVVLASEFMQGVKNADTGFRVKQRNMPRRGAHTITGHVPHGGAPSARPGMPPPAHDRGVSTRIDPSFLAE